MNPNNRLGWFWPRAFARSSGRLAKTDQIDAAMLALYGERLAPKTRHKADPKRAIVAMARRLLIAINAIAKNIIQKRESTA